MEKRKKTVTKNIDLPVTSLVGSYSRDKLERSVDQEKAMTSQDVQETERLTAKNAVEEYIYGIREKISDELQEYMAEDDRFDYHLHLFGDKFSQFFQCNFAFYRTVYSQQLEDTENWLYEDGENVEKSNYVSKLKELKLVGEAAKKRKTEVEGRKAAVDTLGHSLQMAEKVVASFHAGDELVSSLATVLFIHLFDPRSHHLFTVQSPSASRC
jgi:hypothetical protein